MGQVTSGHDDALRTFLAELADAMTDAGESVDVITRTITSIAVAHDAPDAVVMIMPTISVVQVGGVAWARPSAAARGGDLRFDQIAAVYRLVQQATHGGVEPRDGLRQLEQIRAMRPRFGPIVRTCGHAVLALALALMLTPTWHGALLAFGLGVLVGLAKLVRLPTLQPVFPVLCAFVCGVLVFELASKIPVGDPLPLLIAPLATFLPGSMLATATVELAAGQTGSGATRLVAGVVQLGLLAIGILAAAHVVGQDTIEHARHAILLPGWVAPVAVLLFAVGVYLHFSAPAASAGWILLAVFVSYAGQQLGTHLLGSGLSGFFGALLMTPVVLAIADLPRGAPSQLTFLPAFWLLAPGAVGLLGLAQAATGPIGYDRVAAALGAVLAIALGVLIGAAIYRTLRLTFTPRVTPVTLSRER